MGANRHRALQGCPVHAGGRRSDPGSRRRAGGRSSACHGSSETRLLQPALPGQGSILFLGDFNFLSHKLYEIQYVAYL